MKVLSCKCKHKHQDEMHGKTNRVHNKRKSDPSRPLYRCTVCGSERSE